MPISARQLNEIVLRIAETAHPAKIVLIGSYASGEATPNSDLDLLVIVRDSPLPRHQRARLIRRRLWGITDVVKDIKVYTQAEVDEWKAVREAFVTSALESGKVLYENKE
jgi:predicted nucleotidyltransferase